VSLILAEPPGAVTAAVSDDGRRGLRSSTRGVLAVTLGAGAVVLFTYSSWWRSLEVEVSGWLMSVWSGRTTRSYPAEEIIVLYQGQRPQITFNIATECSVGYTVGILMIFAAGLVLVPRLRTGRTLEALGAAAFILLVTNVGRIALLGVVVADLGVARGLVFGHTYLGSVVTLVGTALSGIAFLGVIGLAVRAGNRAE
jgi:exosortase/archaeosortase family protein